MVGAGKAKDMMTVIGLMSGTSMDGVDAAVVRTDGELVAGFGPSLTMAYDAGFVARLRAVVGDDVDAADVATVARELTALHRDAVRRLLDAGGFDAGEIDAIGFHGHTVAHRPDRGVTRQIGDAGWLARETGIPVVGDFRSRDVPEGGQGAPLAPLYHAALARVLEKPLAVLNLGGVANVTWISPDGGVVAFDTGPGNALIDDWARARAGQAMDEGGLLARRGRVDETALAALLDHRYFTAPYPKSLDRDEFAHDAVAGLAVADGAATLTEFTAAAVEKAAHLLPAPPMRWLVTGGGRHNPSLMAALRGRLTTAPVEPVEMVGWRGDALEAQAFGFLAVRSLKGLPLSLPSTTGVKRPTTGGVLHKP